MKKNLRIASAAAAALLAVAPVAASTVSTVLADTTNVTVVGGTAGSTDTTASFDLKVTNALSLVDQDPASKLTASLTTTLPSGAKVTSTNAKILPQNATVATTTDGTVPTVAADTDDNQVKNVTAGTSYKALIYVAISGLTAGKDYTVNNVKVTADKNGQISSFPVLSDVFTIPNAALIGAPYVVEKNKTTEVKSGSVQLAPGEYNVDALVAKIKGAYTVKPTATGTGAVTTADFLDVKSDVLAALKAAGITTKNDAKGSFDKPATSFSVTLNTYANNGAKGTFVVTVNPNASDADKTFPVITYKVKDSSTAVNTPNITDSVTHDSASRVVENIDNVLNSRDELINFNYVPVNGVVDINAIKDAFKAKVSTANTDALSVDVDTSKVNTKVAGKYPVVVSATNAEKKTTKVTFYLTVGAKGATYKTVQSDGDVPVYKIEGNNVTDSKTVVKNGDQIAVFGDPIKVGDKSYTRINSADSDLYVESKYVDGTFKPADKVAKKVMHNAYIYDKDHKRVGTKTLAAYSNVNVYGAATKLADGSLVYQIGDNQYVMADNIDGTVRTLTHNAYVYKTSTKRADRRVLRKGAKVTTYGAPYTFKNGKAYYRIGGPAKQYVKVANF